MTITINIIAISMLLILENDKSKKIYNDGHLNLFRHYDCDVTQTHYDISRIKNVESRRIDMVGVKAKIVLIQNESKALIHSPKAFRTQGQYTNTSV